MSATKLFSAGYTPLVSVIPPDAPLSPQSSIDPGMRGKVPGRRNRSGTWGGYSFLTADPPTLRDAERWDRWGANVGILGRHYPGLDVDSGSAALTRVVLGVAGETLGWAPVRLSVGARRLLVYRAAEPIARMALIVTANGRSHLIEFLGNGRQYLVHGTHPSGEAYRWHGKALHETEPDELADVTRDSVARFFDALQAQLEAAGLSCERVGDGATITDREPVKPESLRAPSDRALAELVLRIPNPETNGWDEYVAVGYAIKAACHDDALGLRIFTKWASLWGQERSDPETDERNWNSFHNPRVGWGWLTEMAEARAGYESAPDDFADNVDMTALPLEEPEEPAAPVLRTVAQSDEWAVNEILPALRALARWVPVSKTWVVWQGWKWVQDELDAADALIVEQLRQLCVRLEEMALQRAKAVAGPFFRAAKRYQDGAGITAVTRLIKSRVAVRPGDFDQHRMLLNTPGGVVDLATGAISPVEPGGYVPPRRGRNAEGRADAVVGRLP